MCVCVWYLLNEHCAPSAQSLSLIAVKAPRSYCLRRRGSNAPAHGILVRQHDATWHDMTRHDAA